MTALTRLKRVEHPFVRDGLLRGRAAIEYARKGHVVRTRKVREYLAATDEPKLQVGTGPNSIAGWLNSDLISGDVYVDLARPLPFPDATFQYVFGEHIIEHLPEAKGASFIGEARRVLRPGGVLRLVTPDLRKLIELYEGRSPWIGEEDYRRFMCGVTGKAYEQPARILNDLMRLWGHRYIYDEPDLVAKLEAAGFRQVDRRPTSESEYPALRGIERHGERFGALDWENDAEAMVIEAVK
jgi:predicted SAM-dependent methyltransferase